MGQINGQVKKGGSRAPKQLTDFDTATDAIAICIEANGSLREAWAVIATSGLSSYQIETGVQKAIDAGYATQTEWDAIP